MERNTMRKELTPEQEAAKHERREKFRALWKQVAAMPELDRIRLSAKFGIRTCDGHEMSVNNQCLCAMQCPAVSIVGGFRQWIKHGRAVCKGQHGMMIWVPVGTGTKVVDGQVEATGEPDEKRFIIGTVFDIGQTQEMETANAPAEFTAATVPANQLELVPA
jgi:hypothetical protein